MKKLFKALGFTILGILLIGVIGAIFGGKDSPSASSKESSEKGGVSVEARVPAVSVTASKLFSDYDSNEVSADMKYKGKLLSVSGTVQSIDKDAFDHIVIHLRSSNEFMPVLAYLDSSHEALAASLSKGQKVSWTCEGSGRLIGSPILKDCAPPA